MVTLPYPGDDLSALMSLNEAMSSAYTELNNLTADVTQSRSQLSSADVTQNPLHQTTVVLDSPTTPDADLFTDPQTHRLLSLEQIEAKGPAATAAFRRWFTAASFTAADQSATVLNAGQGDRFLPGLQSAGH